MSPSGLAADRASRPLFISTSLDQSAETRSAMKTILLFAGLVLAVVPQLAKAEIPIPTQEEAQRKFDGAVSEADRAIIEHELFPNVRLNDESLRHISVGEISDKKEIQAISKYVRPPFLSS